MKVYRDCTIQDLFMSRSGRWSNILFDNVRFTSSRSYQTATVTIYYAKNVTFRNCVFEGSAWNGVSINHDTGRIIENVLFDGCRFEYTDRMSFECTGSDDDTCYYHITLKDRIFEATGSQAISFDGPPLDCNILVQNVISAHRCTVRTTPAHRYRH